MAYYDLMYDDAGKVFVSVPRDVLNKLQTTLNSAHRLVRHAGHGFDLLPFTPATFCNWGFGPSLASVKSESERVTWEVVYPLGKDGEILWTEVASTSATLEVLFKYLKHSMFGISDPGRHQLMLVSGWMCKPGEKGGDFSALVTPHLAKWIEAQSYSFLLGITREAMLKAYEHMKGVTIAGVSADRFRVNKLSCGRLALQQSVHCGLDPQMDCLADGSYELRSHNVDSPFQTLVFLAALAALCQAARDDGV